MTKICIPIAEKTPEKVLKKISAAEKAGAEIIEIWLGELKNPSIEPFVQATKIPLLINCKGEEEQGSFMGTEEKKKEILLQAARDGAKYIDIPFFASDEFFEEIHKRKGNAQIICSKHYFEGTPGLPHLTSDVTKMLKHKPDILKFATMPKTQKDVVTIIRLAEKLCSKKIPHIVIAMGKLGKITRLGSPFLQNEIMFATVDEKSATAPGQMSAGELKQIFQYFTR